MRTMRIAMGSDNGETIVRDHMGEAVYFHVYDLAEDRSWKLVERRKNSSPEEEHGDSGKMKAVMKILEDVDVVVGRMISPNFRNIAARTACQPVIVEHDEISGVMEMVAGRFDSIHELVEQRRKGERFGEIPVLCGES